MQIIQRENSLQTILAVYVVGDMIVMPRLNADAGAGDAKLVDCWNIKEEDKLRDVLTEAIPALSILKPSQSIEDFLLSDQEDSSQEDTTEYNTRTSDREAVPSLPDTLRAGLITIEIWKNNFLIKAWGSDSTDNPKYHPLLNGNIPSSHGSSAVIALLQSFLKNFES